MHWVFHHVVLYTQLIRRWLGEGFDVLAYDQPGATGFQWHAAAIGSFGVPAVCSAICNGKTVQYRIIAALV